MTHGLWSRIGAGYQPQHGVDGNHGGAAVADQRQRQADNGHNTDAHAGIDKHLEEEACRHADAYEHTHRVV